MKKKIKKQVSPKELEDALKKINVERTFITDEIQTKFKTCADISVDTAFNEVWIMVEPNEYDSAKKDFETHNAKFTYESCDNMMASLKYKYKIK